MRVIRKPLEISTPGATYRLTWTPEKGARVAVIGVGVDNFNVLEDHEVTGMSHGARQAVKKSTVNGVDYYVPLGHIANRVEADDFVTNAVISANKFRPWPGRFNNPLDLKRLNKKLADGQRLTRHELLRLTWEDRVPCQSFAMWPLTELVEFRIDLKRIHSENSVNRAWLYLVEFESKAEQQLYCGQPDLTDFPQWVAQALILAEGAGDDGQPHETLWPGEFSGINPHALRIQQIFATAHSNDGAGTIAYAPTYLDAVDVELQRGDGGSIQPFFAEDKITLSEFTNQLLQSYDCMNDPELVLPWFGSLLWQTTRRLTAEAKNIRMSCYGLLRPHTADGGVFDVA